MSFVDERRKARLRITHAYGYCITNNCKLGFPQATGFDMGRFESNTDPKNINCKDKKE